MAYLKVPKKAGKTEFAPGIVLLARLSHLKRSFGVGAGEFRLLSTRVLDKQAR